LILGTTSRPFPRNDPKDYLSTPYSYCDRLLWSTFYSGLGSVSEGFFPFDFCSICEGPPADPSTRRRSDVPPSHKPHSTFCRSNFVTFPSKPTPSPHLVKAPPYASGKELLLEDYGSLVFLYYYVARTVLRFHNACVVPE